MSDNPEKIRSFGPAGSKYNSVQEAGKWLLTTYCEGFPSTTQSFILPSFNEREVNELLEARPGADPNKFRGMEIRQTGEEAENIVYNIIVRMIRQKNLTNPILVLKTFTMDQDNTKNLRKNALEDDIPDLDLDEIRERFHNIC